DFIGKAALQNASREPRLTGITCEAEPHIGAPIQLNGETVGKVTAGAISPYLQHGVGIALMDTTGHAANTEVMIGCIDGELHKGQLADLPLYDKAGEIQRGKKVDIPVRE
ncbi:MAG: glycine cleavage T C-terminal barrel domain-containing protein, partial [Thiolinea sp.]